MRIEHLHINGFGRLHNREIHLTQGVTVLYGRNEAGKVRHCNSYALCCLEFQAVEIPWKGMNLCKADCMGEP